MRIDAMLVFRHCVLACFCFSSSACLIGSQDVVSTVNPPAQLLIISISSPPAELAHSPSEQPHHGLAHDNTFFRNAILWWVA